MAGGGLLYTAQFSNVTVTNAIQDIWQLQAAATAAVLVHSWRVTFVPTITSGVAQDVRVNLQICRRSTTGTGGSAVTPVAVNARNTTAAATTSTRTVVTTQGTIGNILDGEQVSVIVPFERIYTPDQRIVIPAGTGNLLSLFLTTAPGQAFQASSEVYFEEI
jgi:hypothetical protein